jgi:hypothetical protein
MTLAPREFYRALFKFPRDLELLKRDMTAFVVLPQVARCADFVWEALARRTDRFVGRTAGGGT